MLGWLSNPWVIGIGGGVISGSLVTLSTRYLFSRKERREYRQKVQTANNEIIYGIRPAIAEKVIPSSDMLEALFSATARKYEINSDDLISKVALANELMKEVMDNTFLSSQQKVEFCHLLNNMKQAEDELVPQRVVEIVTVRRKEALNFVSITLGLTAALMGLLMTMTFAIIKEKGPFFEKELLPAIPIPMLIIIISVTVLIPILVFIMMYFMKFFRQYQAEYKGAELEESKEQRQEKLKEPTP